MEINNETTSVTNESRTSESLGQLGEALAQAQSEFPTIPKTKTVEVRTHDGKSYKYSYADLADILKVISPITSKYGLSVVQIPIVSNKGNTLVTRLLHSSGEWIESELPLRQQRDGAQALGSVLTYMRRYALSSMLNIATDVDDDGQIADTDHVGAEPEVQTQAPKKQKKPDNTEDLHAFIDGLLDEARGKDSVIEVEKLWLASASKTAELQRQDKKKFDEAVAELKKIREIIDQDEV